MDKAANSTEKIWLKLQADSNAFEQSLDKLQRKRTGCYFTALDLAYAMMQEMVDSLSTVERQQLFQMNFFEPCVGTGHFVFAYLRVCKELGFSREQYQMLLNHIYVCDANREVLTIYRNQLTLLAEAWFGITLSRDYFDAHVGGALLFDVDADIIRYISLGEMFCGRIPENGFDIVVTNPPYKNLKAEHSHYLDNQQKENDHARYTAIKELAAQHFSNALSGTLNLYKLFTEEILEKYLSPNGICSLLIPASILSDQSCTKLRAALLQKCAVRSLKLIAENNNYIDASQALCAMLLRKGQPTKKILINSAFHGDIRQGSYAFIENLIGNNTGNAIFVLSEKEYHMRSIMQKHPRIKDIPYIINLRGELDITANAKAIMIEKTPYPLLRGRHIGYYKINNLPNKEYAAETFVHSAAKQRYIFSERLVCQQIVNMAKKRRIAFALVSPGHVLANSCNFIALESNSDGVDLFFLLGVLNSDLIDWYFRLTSSNNHINNYEIDDFPIPVSFSRKNDVSALVQQYLAVPSESLLLQINALVHEAYGITENNGSTRKNTDEGQKLATGSVFDDHQVVFQQFFHDLKQIMPGVSMEECASITCGNLSVRALCLEKKPAATKFELQVLESMETKYRALYDGRILNHISFKLSNLDLEMISSIPQGGSWKNISDATVQKSKRLRQISRTGGRTTLYGRIDYAKPSYTITTYFNRPGNGTYVHPVHNRVISMREAARFQCFPDDYFFYGKKSAVLKQIGNAVPVLLAYSLGARIREKTGCRVSVDLFSGAGGLTYGFRLAGIHPAAANDKEDSACITLKTNCPEIPIICGDVTKENVKQALIQAGKSAGADIICGGPPCQGFSLAGFRNKDDPRNQLFRHFVEIVSAINPKVIVFENVEGLLSFQGGKTFHDIITLFSELGYNTAAQKLSANHYGAPQRRKRVFILCIRKDIGVQPTELFPLPITPQEEAQTTAFETIYDLEEVPCTETARYTSTYESDFLQYLKRRISIETFQKKAAQRNARFTVSQEAGPESSQAVQLSFL